VRTHFLSRIQLQSRSKRNGMKLISRG
jgi:hypothetical protein